MKIEMVTKDVVNLLKTCRGFLFSEFCKNPLQVFKNL